MKSVFAHLSRDLEEPLFRLIGEYAGSYYTGHSLCTLVFRVTKRRRLGRVMVERQSIETRVNGETRLVSRRFLKADMWMPCEDALPEISVVRHLLEQIPPKFRTAAWQAMYDEAYYDPIRDYALDYCQCTARNEKPAPKNKWFPTSAH